MRTGFWSRVSIIFQILLATITEFVGLVAFVYFLIEPNYQLSAWAFFSFFFALAVTHLHILFLRNDLDDWYESSSFDPMKYLAFIFLTVGLIGINLNLYFAINQQEEFSLHSHYLIAVAAFICSFWCIIIIVCSRKYKRYVQMCQPILHSNRY